jgi:hypothetical protein
MISINNSSFDDSNAFEVSETFLVFLDNMIIENSALTNSMLIKISGK